MADVGADWRSMPCAAEIEAGFECNDGAGGVEHAEFHRVKRTGSAADTREYAELQGRLRDALATTVKGVTAQRLIEAHDEAKGFHHKVADGHEVKSDAYQKVVDIYTRINSKKRDIVIEAQRAINKIQQSKGSAAEKLVQREAIIAQARADLGYHYGQAMTNMIDVGQSVLDRTEQGGSIHHHIKPLGFQTGPKPENPPPAPAPAPSAGIGAAGPATTVVPPAIGDGGLEGSNNLANTLVSAPSPSAPSPPVQSSPLPPVQSSPLPPVQSSPVPSAPVPSAPVSSPGLPGLASAIPAALSGAARVVPPVVVAPVVVPAVAVPPVSHADATPVADSGGGVAHSAPSTFVTAPHAAPVAPVAAEPAGPLPAYGSDVRPPPPEEMVSSPTPASPPVLPAVNGAGAAAAVSPVSGLASTAVVHRVAAAAPPGPVVGQQVQAGAAVLGQSGAASAGMLVGAAAADSVAQQRCDQVVDAVARQEPRVRWAVGTRGDGLMLLATDLAGGWVPPGIGVPRDVELLEPGSLMTMRDVLHSSEFHAEFVPGQEVGSVRADLSDWARKVDPVQDLGWKLRQATQWRDGLPSVAHTLAKAWALGSGARPVELEQLAQALAAQRETVLDSYRGGDVSPHEVGNWMLLATIEAVHAKQPMLAAYHFRWFEAA